MSKSPNPVDKYVGNRVRMRRIDLGMPQDRLGAAIGMTFQQIQKYEKGVNRISSSRLVAISNALEVPVTWFFEGAPGNTNPSHTPIDTTILEFIATRDGISIARNFPRLQNSDLRRSIINLAENLATHDSGALG